ncbi:MAG: GNAT family N-acetyltransferase [Candidatus Symbiobacter sp.]|nr:GNAT family N-acetyltransferase [Candidatus Symbiobacter sp.]
MTEATLSFAQIRADDPQLAALLAASDAYFAALYPAASNHLEDATTLAQPNVTIYGAWVDAQLVACGAVKIMRDDGEYGEIKRVFVAEGWRQQGLAQRIMEKLHAHLRDHGVAVARLETGINEGATLRFYHRLGYRHRPPFGHYAFDPLSVFMEKSLDADRPLP